MKAHGDVTALNYSFYDIVTADEKTSLKPLRDLKHRCLNPGMYAQHLEHWLSFFPPQQMMIIDGEELKIQPAQVMAKLQLFLKLEPVIDYRQKLRFDTRKGFFCPVTAMNTTR